MSSLGGDSRRLKNFHHPMIIHTLALIPANGPLGFGSGRDSAPSIAKS
jgi:hypothetical protein